MYSLFTEIMDTSGGLLLLVLPSEDGLDCTSKSFFFFFELEILTLFFLLEFSEQVEEVEVKLATK